MTLSDDDVAYAGATGRLGLASQMQAATAFPARRPAL